MPYSPDFFPSGMQVTPPLGVTGTVTASVTQITLPAAADAASGSTMRLSNVGTQAVSWCYGVAAGLTATNGVVIPPNQSEKFMVPAGVTQISVIAAATGSSLNVTLGSGG